ncbi:hypothetical protein ACVIGB_002513 [Bradyrhizobium sp. USDA 4341]
MSWLKNLFSPSNLWTIIQYVCPPAAALVSAWLSWFKGLPPSVIMGLALIAAACAIIILDGSRKWLDRRNSHLLRIIELEEQLRAKIKVVSFQCGFLPLMDSRVFEFEIKNDSGDDLQNCLAVVTDMRPIRSSGPRGNEADDMTAIYKPNLPLPLRTARNRERDGGGPFHLRPGQTKKISVCARKDGNPILHMFFEPGKDEYMYYIPGFKSCDLEVTIYGTRTPTVANFRLALNARDELIVTYDGRAPDPNSGPVSIPADLIRTAHFNSAKPARPNIIYEYEVAHRKLEGTPLAWVAIPHLRWAPRGDGGRDIISINIEGKNTGDREIRLKNAYLISGITGARLEMTIKVVDGRNVMLVPVRDSGVIPPNAQINLFSAELNGDDGIEESEFSKHWAPFSFVFEFDGTEHRKAYGRDVVAASIDEEKIDPAEPHIKLGGNRG